MRSPKAIPIALAQLQKQFEQHPYGRFDSFLFSQTGQWNYRIAASVLSTIYRKKLFPLKRIKGKGFWLYGFINDPTEIVRWKLDKGATM